MGFGIVERKGRENILKPDLALGNVTNVDPSSLSVDLQTTGKRALSEGQVKSTL